MIYFIVAGDSDQPIRQIGQEELNMYLAAPEMLKALKAWRTFWEDMPKGQLGKLVFDVGLLNDAFIAMSNGIAKAQPDKEMESAS